jgi:hypothetical protein
MTPEQKTEYKNKVSIALKAYVATNKLEDAENEVIMQNLQGMYRYLEDLNLIEYGLTYAQFVGFAQQAYVMADLQKHFR